MNLKIGTFNICHCGDYSKHEEGDPFELYNVNIEQTANAIKNLNCDIIGLNEVYNDGTDEPIDFKNQTEKLAKLAGYKYYCYAQGHDHGWTDIGNAIFSKYPIKCFNKIHIYTIPENERQKGLEYENRVLAIADVDLGDKTIRFVSTHFGLIPIELERIVNESCKLIDNSELPVIFCGDLNARPEHVAIKKLEEKLKNCAKEMGNEEFTFSSYNPNRHIDYIFVPFSATINDYMVHKIRVSDHLPITADIEI